MGNLQNKAYNDGRKIASEQDKKAMQSIMARQIPVMAELPELNSQRIKDYYKKHNKKPLIDAKLEKRIFRYYRKNEKITLIPNDKSAKMIVLSTAFALSQSKEKKLPSDWVLTQPIMFAEGIEAAIFGGSPGPWVDLNPILKKYGLPLVAFYNPNRYDNGHPGWAQVFSAMLNQAAKTGGCMIQPIGTISGKGFNDGSYKDITFVDENGKQSVQGDAQQKETRMAKSRGVKIVRLNLGQWAKPQPNGYDSRYSLGYEALRVKAFILQMIGLDPFGKGKDKFYKILKETDINWDFRSDFTSEQAWHAAFDRNIEIVLRNMIKHE